MMGTIDLTLFHGTQLSGRVTLAQSLGGDTGRGTQLTGILKLSQNFLTELLQTSGSMPLRPRDGSSFMAEIYQGYIRTQADLLAAFTRALVDIESNLTARERDDDPLDERYGGATIRSVELYQGTAKIYIDLYSQDPNASATLPIETSF